MLTSNRSYVSSKKPSYSSSDEEGGEAWPSFMRFVSGGELGVVLNEAQPKARQNESARMAFMSGRLRGGRSI